MLKKIIRLELVVLAVAVLVLGVTALNAYKTRQAMSRLPAPAPAAPKLTKLQAIVRSTLFIKVNKGTGSATVISKRLAVSASHVCEGGGVTVLDYKGNPIKVRRVVYEDMAIADVCLIEGDFSYLPSMPLADEEELTINAKVFFSGYPERSFRITGATLFSRALITIPNGTVPGRYDSTWLDMIDRECIAGNSGGGVINEQLQLVGVVVAAYKGYPLCAATPLSAVVKFIKKMGYYYAR